MSVFQETVKAIREEYPKFSPACLSLASRTSETGVMLTPRAKSVALSVNGLRRPLRGAEENRTKSVCFRCRLSLTSAESVKQEMAALGLTQQDLLEALLLRWLKESRSPVSQTEERQGDEERTLFTSENTTNL